MLNSVNTNVERIIAKIDNDFNIDHSDWIPRVGAWVIDAMGQINALRKVPKKVKLIVHERIAYSNCPIDSPNLKVMDDRGCVVDQQKSSADCGCSYSTGELTPDTVSIVYNGNIATAPDYTMAETNNDCDLDHGIRNYSYGNNKPKTYVLVDDNKLELNFNANYIYVETEVVETYYSNVYNCELPVIPNNGLLIEAIAYYCMYKMLCRGNKHPVFNLAASQYGTNPYYEWTQLKYKAKTSVIIDAQGDINTTDGGLFRSAFFTSTFG